MSEAQSLEQYDNLLSQQEEPTTIADTNFDAATVEADLPEVSEIQELATESLEDNKESQALLKAFWPKLQRASEQANARRAIGEVLDPNSDLGRLTTKISALFDAGYQAMRHMPTVRTPRQGATESTSTDEVADTIPFKRHIA